MKCPYLISKNQWINLDQVCSIDFARSTNCYDVPIYVVRIFISTIPTPFIVNLTRNELTSFLIESQLLKEAHYD